MIRKLSNLICALGHRHYSPTPATFVNTDCMSALPPKDEGKRPGVCREKLREIRRV